jgi:hypothetical protein
MTAPARHQCSDPLDSLYGSSCPQLPSRRSKVRPELWRDAWESFRQARAKVSGLIDACGQLQEEQAPRHPALVAAQHAPNVIREADTAHDAHTEERDARQPRPETSADHGEPEAGS